MPSTYSEIRFQPAQRKRNGKYFICKQCNVRFYLSPSRTKQHSGHFCSRKCQREYTPKITKVCPVCGKRFTVKASIAHRYTVCDWKCRASVQRLYSCIHCGKEFLSHEQRWEPKYCSVACYRRSKAETNIEKKVRQTLEQISEPFIQEHKIGRYSVDFFLPRINGIIEVDGAYWHRNKTRDERKNKFLNSEGFHLIRLPEKVVLDDDLILLLSSKLSSVIESSL